MTPITLLHIIYLIGLFISGAALGLNIVALTVGVWSIEILMPLVLGIFATVGARLAIKVLQDT